MSKRKSHRIYARDPNVQLDGLKISTGKVEFGKNTAVYVDENTAREVDERYGRKGEDSVIVAKDEQYDRALNGEGWKIQYDKKKGDWVKTVHKYRFEGVDTSHFVKRKIGDKKNMGGSIYIWNGKWWTPEYEWERDNAALSAEVGSGFSTDKPDTKHLFRIGRS